MKRVITDMHMSEVAIAYGMTETSPVSTQTRFGDDLERRTETVGRVLPHLEIKIIDPSTGVVVPQGEAGELCTRGYSVMLGYWNEPEMTAEAIDAARWMHTGDLAVMRPDGYVNIVGRLKDMVIRGGENIYPREIEEFLYGHPDIEEVAVIGVPDHRYGEELMAWIRLRSGARGIRRRGASRVLHRQDRSSQDPPVHPIRRQLSDDSDGKSPKGRDPLRQHRPTRAGGFCGDSNGVNPSEAPLIARRAVAEGCNC